MLFNQKDTKDLIIGASTVVGVSLGAFLGSEIIILLSIFEAIALMYINNDINKRRGK